MEYLVGTKGKLDPNLATSENKAKFILSLTCRTLADNTGLMIYLYLSSASVCVRSSRDITFNEISFSAYLIRVPNQCSAYVLLCGLPHRTYKLQSNFNLIGP